MPSMNIAVILGGFSAERDVSLASGLRIAEALRSRGHTVTCVDPAAEDAWGALTPEQERALLAAGVGAAPPSLEALGALGTHRGIAPELVSWPAVRDAEVLFLALHGGQGEDGTLQALLDLAGLRYTGSGHLASALAMDKQLSKICFRDADVGTADWLMAPRPDSAEAGDFPKRVTEELRLPVVVKPSKQGSSVALTVVRDAAQLAPAIAEAFRYDDEVIVEGYVAGRELTVGILGDQALPVIEIIPQHEVYDYECKYTPGMAEERVADLAPAAVTRVQEEARRAFTALKLRGYARVDFRMDARGDFYCLEANTLPGMTATSLIPQAAAAAGIDFPDLCERIATMAARAAS